jgi:hypothetical protein
MGSTFAWILKGVRSTRAAFQFSPWNHAAIETSTIDDGDIDVDSLLEDTPEAAEARRQKEQCVGLPAQQLLNALQKVWTIDLRLSSTLY